MTALTERQISVIRMALWRFMNEAHLAADRVARVGATQNMKNFDKFIEDAADAEKLLEIIKAEGTVNVSSSQDT